MQVVIFGVILSIYWVKMHGRTGGGTSSAVGDGPKDPWEVNFKKKFSLDMNWQNNFI
jgi:hypothetical protein